MARLDVRYADCPTVCGQTEKPAEKFCEGCPIIKTDKRFQKETIAALNERAGEKWRRYSFESLQKAVVAVSRMADEGDDGSWTIDTELLVKTYREERAKIERGEHQAFMARMEALRAKGNGGRK